jgi:5-methylthioadenosine/S-adenosylhomocysteine deaminase
MAASGTTSFSDMYMFCDVIAERAIKAGMKLNLGRGVSFFGDSFDFDTYHSTAESKSLLKRWHGFDDGRIRLDACVHGEYTSTPEVWRGIADFAKANKLGIHLHLSETKREHEECVQRRGMTPTEAFLDAGIFDSPVTAAHCVWLDPGDIDILARYGATAVHCPISNMKLGSGIAPVPELLAAGVTVALGTDGVSSNNSHDMFEEIKATALIHKAARLDPSLISARTALEMATVAGAKAQGRENECGRIRVGFDADLALLDFSKPQLSPCHDPLSNLVYSARGSDIILTMVRGRVIYNNGEYLTIDAERAVAELDYVMKKVFG